MPRIFPDYVAIDSYIVPHGADRGRTHYYVSISDKRYSKELFWSFDRAAVVRFANRSAGRRGLPVVDLTKDRS